MNQNVTLENPTGWMLTAIESNFVAEHLRQVRVIADHLEKTAFCPPPVLDQMRTWLATCEAIPGVNTPVTSWELRRFGTLLPRKARPVAVLADAGEILLQAGDLPPAGVLLDLVLAANNGKIAQAQTGGVELPQLHLHYPAQYVRVEPLWFFGERWPLNVAERVTYDTRTELGLVYKDRNAPS